MAIAQKAMSDQEAANTFRTLFENAVARHLLADVPVSYTHLDVYKRQGMDVARPMRWPRATPSGRH